MAGDFRNLKAGEIKWIQMVGPTMLLEHSEVLTHCLDVKMQCRVAHGGENERTCLHFFLNSCKLPVIENSRVA